MISTIWILIKPIKSRITAKQINLEFGPEISGLLLEVKSIMLIFRN